MFASDSFAVTTADERPQLEAFLDEHRRWLNESLDGLSEEEARLRLVPSLTTLLGLVKHATFVEQVWFQQVLTGTPRAQLGLPETVDESFGLSETDTIASVQDAHRRACIESVEAAAQLDLDDVVTGHRFGPLTLRWIHLHLLRELAQHAGHADILREQILDRRG